MVDEYKIREVDKNCKEGLICCKKNLFIRPLLFRILWLGSLGFRISK